MGWRGKCPELAGLTSLVKAIKRTGFDRFPQMWLKRLVKNETYLIMFLCLVFDFLFLFFF